MTKRIREKVVLLYRNDETLYAVPCANLETAISHMVAENIDPDESSVQLYEKSANDELIDGYESRIESENQS